MNSMAAGYHAVGDDGGDAGAGGGNSVDDASKVRVTGGLGRIFTTTSPPRPKDPRNGITSPSRSIRLARAFAAQGDDLAPAAPCHAHRLLVVRPYFKQCSPPEFSATLPPMVQATWLEDRARIEAVGLHRLGDIEIGDAGLDHDAAILIIDFDDALHAPIPIRMPSSRGRAPPTRGAGAARHDGHALGLGIFQNLLTCWRLEGSTQTSGIW